MGDEHQYAYVTAGDDLRGAWPTSDALPVSSRRTAALREQADAAPPRVVAHSRDSPHRVATRPNSRGTSGVRPVVAARRHRVADGGQGQGAREPGTEVAASTPGTAWATSGEDWPLSAPQDGGTSNSTHRNGGAGAIPPPHPAPSWESAPGVGYDSGTAGVVEPRPPRGPRTPGHDGEAHGSGAGVPSPHQGAGAAQAAGWSWDKMPGRAGDSSSASSEGASSPSAPVPSTDALGLLGGPVDDRALSEPVSQQSVSSGYSDDGFDDAGEDEPAPLTPPSARPHPELARELEPPPDSVPRRPRETDPPSPERRGGTLHGGIPDRGEPLSSRVAVEAMPSGGTTRAARPRRRRRRRRKKRLASKKSTRVHTGPRPHLNDVAYRRLTTQKATPGPGAYSPIVSRVGGAVRSLVLNHNRGAFFGSSHRPWQARPKKATAPGPGHYQPCLSSFTRQADSEKETGRAVGFTKAKRRGEAQRFYSKTAGNHPLRVVSDAPGPGRYDVHPQVPLGERWNTHFGLETRERRKSVFVSRAHSQLDRKGIHSPGPASYAPSISGFRSPQRPASARPARRRTATKEHVVVSADKRKKMVVKDPSTVAVIKAGLASPGPKYYPRPSSFDHRKATSFGKGGRSSMRFNDVPGPGTYKPTLTNRRQNRASYFPATRR